MKKLIGYARVSTKEQGTSRNGLEAQREMIENFAAFNGYELIEIVEEVASGTLGQEDRPVLDAAVQKSLKTKAHLVVSKLDRLSRDASFILNLMNTKANFIVAELGEQVSPFMLHIYAVVAEQERAMISARTTAALARVKAKGKKLGNPRLAQDGDKLGCSEAGQIGGAVQAAAADKFADRMRKSIERMVATGMSLRAIAQEFNENGTATARGGKWSAGTVSNMMARWTA